MDEIYCRVNGTDITKYIEEVSWESNDLDAPKSGRDLSGVMHRGRVGEKRKLLFKLVPTTARELIPILRLVRREYVTVSTNMIPEDGDVEFQGYNSTRKGGVIALTTDGVLKHKDISFNRIER